jgi:hypothetical protein
MKLTRTGTSSSSSCAGNNGSGVSNASGGRTFPHLGSAKGSETGLNSEMCAGTRTRWRSDSPSGARRGCTRIGTTGVHQASTQANAQQTKIQLRRPPRTRCDTCIIIRLSDVEIAELVVEGSRFFTVCRSGLSERHTTAPETGQSNPQFAWNDKPTTINSLQDIKANSL